MQTSCLRSHRCKELFCFLLLRIYNPLTLDKKSLIIIVTLVLLLRINVCNLDDLPFSSDTGYGTTDVPSFLKKCSGLFWHGYGANGTLTFPIINLQP